MIFELNLPKKNVFLVEKRKSEHQNKIQHSQIRRGTKLDLPQTMFNFWIKFVQKVYFQSKTEKVIIIIEFNVLEKVYISNFI